MESRSFIGDRIDSILLVLAGGGPASVSIVGLDPMLRAALPLLGCTKPHQHGAGEVT